MNCKVLNNEGLMKYGVDGMVTPQPVSHIPYSEKKAQGNESPRLLISFKGN
ncbi:hypothetical protein EVA_10126 [gut metagenome]|uniref:Uncharacterized protein n=1 Tax=gut metagenome TaxID=749906 RepID=J9G4I1_9ZZZZ